ncbi:threonine aldolase family protein [Microlunatus endophyticus]|uniref:threonine aldolase family protein n=1 Tax=Microlunatus endophyticus TaxID=1716077 RepID=UPI001669488A|nr:beta-eliminating lyase-related protein [Microlunatus endophyticus]
MTDDLAGRFRKAYAAASETTSWRRPADPATAFAALAAACTELGIDEWDLYAGHGAVERLEQELTTLLGKPAAAYFPSGVMAQQVALRIHADRSGSRRVALPDLSHLLVHEEDGPRILQDLRFEFLTRGFQPPHVDQLAAIPGRLAAVLVELPLRDAGCLLPTFEELADLSAGCRERGIALHVDGARIWESQDHFGRSLAEIAELADTVYVSFYKGLGGLAGSALLGSEDLIAEARLWRRRMGGTIYRNTAEAVSALVGLRDRLPLMADCAAWARSFAAALPESITVQPPVPHTNQFLIFTGGDPDKINERLVAYAESSGLALGSPWRATSEPGRAVSELNIGDGALELDPVELAAAVAEIAADTM